MTKYWYEEAGPERGTVISSCVQLSRNLQKTPFPARLNTAGKRAVQEKCSEAFFGKGNAAAGRFSAFTLPALPAKELIALAERGTILPYFAERPEGRALFVTEDESCSVMVNGEDHFLIQVRAPGLSLADAYRKADMLDSSLDRLLSFAFDERLGYLTQNPALLGTGMSVAIRLHLPALTDSGAAARMAANLRPLGISLRGALSAGNRSQGAVYLLSNRMTLGISEQEAITNLSGIAGQIIAQERAEREKLVRSLSVQDTVGRSLGIFRSARLLSYDEFLNLASIVRFGISGGLVRNISFETIDSIAVGAQPANLSLASGKMLTQEEENAARAELIRKKLDETGSK